MAVQLGSAVGKIEIDASGVQSGIEAARRSLTSAQSSFQAVGSTVSNLGTSLALLGAPLVALGGAATKTAGDFEAAMNVLSTAVGDSGASLDELRAVALRAGADVNLIGVNSAQVVEAMTNFAKAGVPVKDMLGDMQGYLAGTSQLGGQLRAAIDLAAASELSLAEASDLVITTMATFGLSSDQASAAMNSYVRAADASVASVSDLRDAIYNVGPTMASFGFSLDDTNTLLAILSMRGIAGAEAGTKLKSMFNHLFSGSKDVAEALTELNVSLFDSSGKLKPVNEIIGELSTALAENATITYMAGGASKEQARELAKLGGQIADTQAMIEAYQTGQLGASMSDKERIAKIESLNKKLEEYRWKHQQLLKEIPGVTEQTVELTQQQRLQYIQTLAGSYGQAALNTLLAEGADGWQRMSTQIATASTMQETAAARTRGFNAAMTQLRDSVETFLITAGTPLIQNVLTPLVQMFTGLMNQINSLNPAFVQIAVVAGAVAAGLGGFLLVVGKVITAFGVIKGTVAALGAVLGGLSLPVLAIIAVIGLLAAAWINNWGGIREKLVEVWSALQPVLITLRDWLATNLPVALQTLAGFWQSTLLPAIQAVGEFVIGQLLPLLVQLAGWLATNLPVALQTLAGFWQSILLPAIQAVWGFITDKLVPLLVALADVLSATVGLAVQALAGLWQNVLWPALQAVWDVIANQVEPVFQALAKGANEVLGPALAWLNEKVVQPLANAFSHVGDAIDRVIGWLHQLADKIRGIQLPDWLTPGSPTPFETGLWGIVDALRAVSRADVPWLNKPTLAPALAAAAPATPQTVNHYSFTVTVNAAGSGRDVQTATEQGVLSALRSVGVRW